MLASSVAFAQPNETSPGASGSVEGSAELSAPVPAAPVVTPAPAEPVHAEPVKADDGVTDHEKVVGKIGVMYFGISQQPIGTGAPNAVGESRLSMPYVGARYWLAEKLGVDVGLGFGMSGSSTHSDVGGRVTDADGASVLAFGIHGGVPLVLGTGKHYKFLVVPELNFGYATQSERAQNVPNPPPDIHRYGFRFDLGARVGSEIQFGFIGVPQLALQASVGLAYRHEVWGASQEAGANNNPVASSSSRVTDAIGTTVQSDPWALFTNNISAIYYLP